MEDISKKMFETDFAPQHPGLQNVPIHVITFDDPVSAPLMEIVAGHFPARGHPHLGVARQQIVQPRTARLGSSDPQEGWQHDGPMMPPVPIVTEGRTRDDRSARGTAGSPGGPTRPT